MNIEFPLKINNRGHTASSEYPKAVRNMIEEFLFTNTGERVNRPDFGSGLLQMVFAKNSPELAAALQFTIQAGLRQYLGDIIDLQSVKVESENEILNVTVIYILKQSGEIKKESFENRSVL
jgi:uncharacterized protein